MTSISAAEYAIVAIVCHTFLLSTFGLLVVAKPCEVLRAFLSGRELLMASRQDSSGVLEKVFHPTTWFRVYTHDFGFAIPIERLGRLLSSHGSDLLARARHANLVVRKSGRFGDGLLFRRQQPLGIVPG